MTKFLAYVIATVIVIPALILFLFLNAVVGGLATQLYWTWFLIPIFPTLLPLSLGKAVGLSMFVHLFFLNVSRYDHEQEKLEGVPKAWYGVKKMLILYAVIFITGYVVHLIIG